jgi:serine/threonine protein kinase
MKSSIASTDSISILKEISNDNDLNRNKFREILKDSFINWDLEQLNEYYDECKLNSSLPEWLRGGIGFLLFSVAVEILPTTNRNQEEKDKLVQLAEEICYSIFENIAIYKFIVSEYRINTVKDLKPESDIEFHKCGTTSYILKMRFTTKFDNKEVALKILKYKYFNNQTINRETKNYQSTYKDDQHMPKIHKSDCAFIIMDYISGITLNECIQDLIPQISSKKEKDKFISKIILEICNILTHFARDKKINHNDLNANNIILHNLELKNSNEYFFKIYLIDFGVNYLINEDIGSSQALDKVGVFIPAEVLMDLGNASIMSDIYSVGVILLKMLINKKDFENSRFDDYIDAIRLDYPVLSSLLDDILDKNPDMRLYDLQRNIKHFHNIKVENIFGNLKGISKVGLKDLNHKFSVLYDNIQRIIKMEFDIIEITGKKKRKKVLFAVEKFFSIISGKSFISTSTNKPIYNYIFDIDDNENLRFKKQIKKLGVRSFIADVSNLLVWVGFIFILSVYWGYKPPFNFRSIGFIDVVSAFVLLSYSMIAVNYYKNVFGSLYTKKLKRLGLLTDFWLRVCTIYWPIPILFAYFKGEHWWAYVAALGTFIVAINNLLNLMLALVAKKRIKDSLDVDLPQLIEDRLKDFKFWWVFMLLYAGAMLSFGIFLNSGGLKDELAFLIITLLVNIKMYLVNCQDQAFNITKALKFIYTRYDRLLRNETN